MSAPKKVLPVAYEPDAIEACKQDPSFIRAVENLAEVLDVHVDTAMKLATEWEFSDAVAELASARIRAVIQWYRRTERGE